jgi:DNA-binding NtrC family response regulator
MEVITKMKKCILVVDDQKMTREFLLDALAAHYEMDEAEDMEAALRHIEKRQFDIILTDVKMNDRNEGMELLKIINKRSTDSIVIVMTGYASVEQATEAIRLGD